MSLPAGSSRERSSLSPALEAIGLTKVFDGFRAVDDVSFSVPRGQVCALLGPNGAGKTTTIHMLLGLTKPTSGRALVLGHDSDRQRSAALADTNFMASYVSLPHRVRVREALLVAAELYEVDHPRRAVDEVIELFKLGDLARKTYASLSTGQQTMVCLAKAMVNRPLLLFLDEPTASLDPENALDARTLLRRVADERQTTILITSHNMVEIERIADRILFMSGGRLVADATAAELRARYGAENLEEVFMHVARGAR